MKVKALPGAEVRSLRFGGGRIIDRPILLLERFE